MNPMTESWKVMKGDEEFRINPRHMSAQDRKEFEMRGYNPDDFPTSVPRAIQQGRPVNVHRTPSFPIRQGHGIRYGGNNPVARMEGEDTEGLRPGDGLDAQGVVGNRGNFPRRGHKRRHSNKPTTAKIGEDSGEGDSGARASHMGGYIEDIGQQVQAMPSPSPGQVDDLSRQAGGGILAQTSGFQSKPHGRFFNRQPKMGPAGLPQNMGAFDQVNPQFKQTLRDMNIQTGYPMIESWGALLKESMCKGKDCKGCRGCKSCDNCKGSTCEKMGCA
tara:strand:- start:851 stop:1672 length:822 start_codon:yes stop_codon:yes gene_type:complete